MFLCYYGHWIKRGASKNETFKIRGILICCAGEPVNTKCIAARHSFHPPHLGSLHSHLQESDLLSSRISPHRRVLLMWIVHLQVATVDQQMRIMDRRNPFCDIDIEVRISTEGKEGVYMYIYTSMYSVIPGRELCGCIEVS